MLLSEKRLIALQTDTLLRYVMLAIFWQHDIPQYGIIGNGKLDFYPASQYFCHVCSSWPSISSHVNKIVHCMAKVMSLLDEAKTQPDQISRVFFSFFISCYGNHYYCKQP